MWHPINKGKFAVKNFTAPQLIFFDPDYFFWAHANNVFKFDPLKSEFDIVNDRCRRIKIEPSFAVEYAFHPTSGKFAGFEIVPSSREPHAGSTPTIRTRLLDMSYPRRAAGYDKLGYKLFMKSFKHHFFGNESKRITKVLAEQFFDNTQNFAS